MLRRMGRGLSWLCLLVVFLWTGVASASAAATTLFKKGREHFDKKDYAAACASFAESKRLKNGVGVNYWLGRCHAELGQTASAWTAYSESASLAQARGSDKQAAAAKAKADELEPTLAKLTVNVAKGWKDKLTVRVGKTEVRGSSFGLALPFDPGKHAVRATAAGFEPWTGSVTVPSSGEVSVTVPALKAAAKAAAAAPTPTSTPGPAAEKGASRGRFWGGIITLGVGVTAGVVGGVLVGTASDPCTEDPESVACFESVHGTMDGSEIAGVSLIVGGSVMAIVGTTLAIIGASDGKKDDAKVATRPRVVPLLSPRYVGLRVAF